MCLVLYKFATICLSFLMLRILVEEIYSLYLLSLIYILKYTI